MTATATEARTVTLHLEAGCDHADCATLAHRMFTQLGVPKYSLGASLQPMPSSLEQWRASHRTARKRADRAQRLGYRFAEVDYSQHNDAIHEINVSKPERQGRPMSAGYLEPHDHKPLPGYLCDRHRIQTYGILQGDTLRAYLSLYSVGQLRLVSMIIGHGSHEPAGIMYALFHGVVAEHAGEDAVFFYNRHDSGRPDGLVFLKERLGFRAGDIEWVL